ncbi:MAG: Crp/Fnr family transcriptional regulator, partial [Alphaproteobacteria bacterium]|nr:Crp/Fnr family transcriptional regulator [Alphaproteobacteria bacterium]
PPDAVLYEPGQYVQTVYFPCGETLVSFMVSSDDGRTVETMQVGREGAVGGIVSQGRLPAFTRIMVQSGGKFLALPVAALDEAKIRSRRIDDLFARYADCMLAQIFQATACNAIHAIEQRTAKWILAAAEHNGGDEVLMTQDRLSAMLGVGRSYISRIIRRYKEDGIISVRRGRIFIHDIDRLRAKSCGCNTAIREHFDVVLKGVYPNGE